MTFKKRAAGEPKRIGTRRAADRSFKVKAFCVLLGLLCISPAMGRGGGHGMGGFGLHGVGRTGRGEHVMAPAYVLITVSSISDADVFKKAIENMTIAAASFSGRLAADAEKPAAWEGAAAARVLMIQFANADQAQAWKNSDAYKSFAVDFHKSSAWTIQMVQGLPVPEAREGRGRRGLDAKAFEPNVQDFDRLLNQRLKTICRGC